MQCLCKNSWPDTSTKNFDLKLTNVCPRTSGGQISLNFWVFRVKLAPIFSGSLILCKGEPVTETWIFGKQDFYSHIRSSRGANLNFSFTFYGTLKITLPSPFLCPFLVSMFPFLPPIIRANEGEGEHTPPRPPLDPPIYKLKLISQCTTNICFHQKLLCFSCTRQYPLCYRCVISKSEHTVVSDEEIPPNRIISTCSSRWGVRGR